MLFMVIERFKDGDFRAIGDRFRSSGRMLPESVIYHASWIDSQNSRCLQIMEAPDRESLESASNDGTNFLARVDRLQSYFTTALPSRLQARETFGALPGSPTDDRGNRS
jgi:hypothetical protein